MSKRRILRALIVLILALTLACGIIPQPPVTPLPPTSTPSPQFVNLFPPEAPTPISTTIPSSADAITLEPEITDSNGKAIMKIPNSTVDLSIEAKDSSSGQQLKEIQIQAFLVDNKTRILVVALDPVGEYLPLYQFVNSPVSRNENLGSMGGVFLVKAQFNLAVLLLMVKRFELLNTGRSAYEFYRNMPEIKDHSYWHADSCFTGDQLAEYFGFISGAATALIPIPDAGTELEKQLLDAIFLVSTHTAGESFEDSLRSLPDKYLIRIHRFPKPNFTDAQTLGLSLIGIEYLGQCDSPTPAITVTIESPLVQIGFFNPIYLRYDPDEWEAFNGFPDQRHNSKGEPVEWLRHRTISGCILHDNIGRGTPASWERLDTNRVIGSLEYRVESWTDTATQKPVLIVYQYPVGDSGYGTRIELAIDQQPEQCINSAEDILIDSSDLISVGQ